MIGVNCSPYSIVAVMFIALAITIRSLSSFHRHPPSTNGEGALEYWPSDMVSALTCISYCSLTFLCHFNLFAIEGELRESSRKKIQSIIVVSMVIAFTIYIFVAVFGYIEVSSYYFVLSNALHVGRQSA